MSCNRPDVRDLIKSRLEILQLVEGEIALSLWNRGDALGFQDEHRTGDIDNAAVSYMKQEDQDSALRLTGAS
jgi:hypothetical protein